MKYLPIVLLCLGCTKTQLTLPNGAQLNRTSFLQRNEIGLVEVRKDGTVTMKGYRNDGGNEALAAAVSAAVTAAVKSAAPVP